jgi:RNA polymerase sigma-70 factor (ECF subfamily)
MQASPRNAEFDRLLLQSRWLGELAHRLARDPATADDLVQETWRAALEHPRPAIRDPRGWLASLLANFARQRARSERNRRAREEHCARVERVEGPDAVVERAEAQRKLLEAMLALDEPYRATLIARFVEGESPERIAERTGANASTVRTRLSRGTADLRARLERRDGDRWLAVLAPLLREGAGSPPAATAATSPAAGFSIGTLALATSTKLALAAVCALVVWLAWPERSPEPPPVVSGPTAPAPLAEDRPIQRESMERTPIVALEPTPAAATAPTTPTQTIRAEETTPVDADAIEVLVRRDGRPLVGTDVWVAECLNFPGLADRLDASSPIPKDHRSEATDRRGVANFPGLAEKRKYQIGLEPSSRGVPAQRIAAIFAATGRRYVFDVGSGRVSGRVLDSDGRPRVGAAVSVSLAANGTETASLVSLVTTGADGRYEVGSLPPGSYRVMMDPDGSFDGAGLAQQKECALEEGGEATVDFGDPRGDPRCTGTLRNELGDSVAGPGMLRLYAEDGSAYAAAEVDEDGRFELAVAPGRWTVVVVVASAPQNGFELGTVEMERGGVQRDLVLRGARLCGSVRGFRTEPGVSSGLLVSVRPRDREEPAAVRRIFVDLSGRYALEGLEPGTWILSTSPHALADAAPVEVVVREGEKIVVRDLVVRE